MERFRYSLHYLDLERASVLAHTIIQKIYLNKILECTGIDISAPMPGKDAEKIDKQWNLSRRHVSSKMRTPSNYLVYGLVYKIICSSVTTMIQDPI